MSGDGVVISIEGLHKSYGKFEALHGIDIEVRKGEIFGFLGPNGAGKTTAIRIMLDLIRATSGTVKVFGLNPYRDSTEIRVRIGYLPGEIGYNGDQRGRDFLRYMKELQGGRDDIIDSLAQRFKLDTSKRVRDYSKGNRQKLNLVQAFMHDPELYILDEPTSGLDPLMQNEFYALLREERARGKTTFLSSHLLPEIEHVCDRVCIIREGRVVTVESVDSLKEKMGKVMSVTFSDQVSPEDLAMEGVKSVERDGDGFRLIITGNVDRVIKVIADHSVLNMTFEPFSLEHLFLEYYNNGGSE